MHHVLIAAAAISALLITPMTASASGPGDPELPPTGWAPADTADTLYRDARRALNGGDVNRAATLFSRIHGQHPGSAYAADAYYWEAFARHRLGGEANLRRALALLEEQGRRHPDARTREDARTLETRVRGSLAESGDRGALQRLAREARSSGAGCEDADLRAAALVALARSEPDRATDLARDVLRRRDECSTSLREQAVHLLARQGSGDAVPVLRNVVRTDPASSVQEAALHALVRTADDTRSLIDLYGELQEERHRELLLYSIRRAGDDRAMAFIRGRVLDRREPDRIREAALYALARGASPQVLVGLYRQLEHRRLREATLYQIARADDPAALTFLRQRVLDQAEDRSLREAALHQLARRASPSEVAEMYQRLDDPRLREAAVYSLARSPVGEAVDILIDIARTETDRRLREAAVHALGRSDDPRARRFLRELVTRP